MNRVTIINDIISKRGYKKYLEIGVENPNNCFNHIVAEHKDGVDPYQENPYYPKEFIEEFKKVVKFNVTSDQFFEQNKEKYDIIFIDGLHTVEQCDKDILNAMMCLNENGCVVVHDSLPENEDLTKIESFQNGKCWTGDVWKSVYKYYLLMFEVNVVSLDWGIAVIEKTHEITETIKNALKESYNFLNYKQHFKTFKNACAIPVFNPIQNYVSYFVCSYHTPTYKIKNIIKCLEQQTDQRWELVILDDNDFSQEGMEYSQKLRNILSEYKHLKKIRYYQMYPNSNGYIGESKRRATQFCNGFLVAEIDHDDEIINEMTEILQKVSRHPLYKHADFFYTDCTEVTSIEKYDSKGSQHKKVYTNKYPDGFGMGYGSYRCENVMFPLLKDKKQKCHISVQQNINPKTIRHIVGVPNHIRCWRREFLLSIMSYNGLYPHADDYELLVRTFLKGQMCKIPVCGYIQYRDNETSQDSRRNSIQEYVHAISSYYDIDIRNRFNELLLEDWVFTDIEKGISKYAVECQNRYDCEESVANTTVSKEDLLSMKIKVN